VNFANHLQTRSADAVAYVDGRGFTHHTCGELLRACDARARALAARGVGPGDRVLVLIPPGFELFASLFAVFKTGATVVLLDPSVSREALERCLSRVAPRVLLGTPAAHLLRRMRRRSFRSVTLPISTGWWGGERLHAADDAPFEARSPLEGEPAAILFTSGATGAPKGCSYTHAHLEAVADQLRTHLGLRVGDVVLTTFPAFGLFAPALGVTSVLPPIDLGRPARADAHVLAHAVALNRCTTTFGSPALLTRLVEGHVDPAQLATLRLVLCAGAPVSDTLATRLAALVPGALVLLPYGATESLLVSVRRADDLPADSTLGVCVGRPVPSVKVRVKRLDGHGDCAPGEIGELIVAGPGVITVYASEPELTAAAHLEENGVTFHRMGDVGALDASGQLWLAGRRSHVVATRSKAMLFPVPVERVVEACAGVRCAALVEVVNAPVVVFEPIRGADLARVRVAIRTAIDATPWGSAVTRIEAATAPFPVDRRHNAKIDRTAIGRALSRSAPT
jgi:acyl-CoA synthetase (AMP-forming)/AMP-acid ligase II